MSIKKDLKLREDEDINLIEAINNFYESKPETKKERSYFYMSEAGKCKKAIYHSFKSKEGKKFDSKTKRILENGDFVHMRYQKLFAEMGILIGAELELNNELVHGRCDALITDGKKNYIVDIKSCSQWTYNTLIDAKPDDKIQVMMYLYYFNLTEGFLLYENKDNQSIKIFKIILDRPFIENLIKELTILKENIVSDIEPDCNYDKDKCKYCEHKKTCNAFIGANVKELDISPEYIG